MVNNDIRVDSVTSEQKPNTENEFKQNVDPKISSTEPNNTTETNCVNITSDDLDCKKFTVLQKPFNPNESPNRRVDMVSSNPLKERPKSSYKDCKICDCTFKLNLGELTKDEKQSRNKNINYALKEKYKVYNNVHFAF